MNYETLNNNVMLVELTQDEMKRFHITYDSLGRDNEHTEKAIKSILKEISQKEFHINDKILVEALPIDDGGCFFIFTFSEKKHRYKLKKSSQDVFFYTESINELLDCISSVQKRNNASSPCRLFKMNNNFYLNISPAHRLFYPTFKEFGRLTTSFSKEILNEHGEYMGEFLV